MEQVSYIDRNQKTVSKGGSSRIIPRVHKGLSIVAKDLRCVITQKHSEMPKTLVDGVNVLVRSGRLVALMGPSGAGKSTLMNILAGRLKVKLLPPGEDICSNNKGADGRMRLQGEIFFDGQPGLMDVANKMSGYVMQHDTLLEYLTVEETLSFGASLKLKRQSVNERKIRVDMVMEELGLLPCRNTRIGGAAMKGVSSSEKKRVSLGLELLSDPKLIFLDEPTSGLDASLAYDVIQVLSSLALSGRTLVVSIHQPRSQIFSFFDDLVILSKGHLVYHGEVATATEYFRSVGYQCPEKFNPADFYMDILTPGDEDDNTENYGEQRFYVTDAEVDTMPAKFEASPWKERLDRGIENLLIESNNLPILEVEHVSIWLRFMAWVRSLGALVHRHNIGILRNFKAWMTDNLLICLIAAVTGMVYFQVEIPKDYETCNSEEMHNFLGSLCAISTNIAFSNVHSVTWWPLHRVFVNKEIAGNYYRRATASMGLNLAGMCSDYFVPVVFSIITYWMMGFEANAGKFFEFVLICCVTKFTAVGIAYLIGSLAPNVIIAMSFLPIINILFSNTAGFMIPDSEIPVWYNWLKYISYIRYSFAAFIFTQIDNKEYLLECGNINAHFDYWANLAITLGLGLVCRLLAYLFNEICFTKYGLQD